MVGSSQSTCSITSTPGTSTLPSVNPVTAGNTSEGLQDSTVDGSQEITVDGLQYSTGEGLLERTGEGVTTPQVSGHHRQDWGQFHFLNSISLQIILFNSNRARTWVTIHGVTPRDWSLLGSKRDNWGLDTRIIHNKIFYGICILHCCTLWFR